MGTHLRRMPPLSRPPFWTDGPFSPSQSLFPLHPFLLVPPSWPMAPSPPLSLAPQAYLIPLFPRSRLLRKFPFTGTLSPFVMGGSSLNPFLLPFFLDVDTLRVRPGPEFAACIPSPPNAGGKDSFDSLSLRLTILFSQPTLKYSHAPRTHLLLRSPNKGLCPVICRIPSCFSNHETDSGFARAWYSFLSLSPTMGLPFPLNVNFGIKKPTVSSGC